MLKRARTRRVMAMKINRLFRKMTPLGFKGTLIFRTMKRRLRRLDNSLRKVICPSSRNCKSYNLCIKTRLTMRLMASFSFIMEMLMLLIPPQGSVFIKWASQITLGSPSCSRGLDLSTWGISTQDLIPRDRSLTNLCRMRLSLIRRLLSRNRFRFKSLTHWMRINSKRNSFAHPGL